MKQTILALLMAAMIATPCFSQKVEPEGMFSIEGTVWQIVPIQLMIFPFPWIEYDADFNFSFYGGEVFGGYEQDLRTWWRDNSFYMDMLACSIFITGYSVYSVSTQQTVGNVASHIGIMQPTMGIGILITNTCCITATNIPIISIALLSKTDENWKPPAVD